jgi:hypothetical protein
MLARPVMRAAPFASGGIRMPNGQSKASRKPSLGADLVIPALAVGFTFYFLDSIWELAWEAKVNGVIIGGALLALVAIQAVRIFLQVSAGEATLGFDKLTQPASIQRQRIALIALAAAFVGFLPWFGVTLGLFLFLLLGMMVMGVRRPGTLLGVSFGVAASVYLLFIAFLGTRYPPGPIEKLIAWLVGAGG